MPSLFNLSQVRELERLEPERATLAAELQTLKPSTFRRAIIQDRLNRRTWDAMRVERELRAELKVQ
jgi:hypothetical protein